MKRWIGRFFLLLLARFARRRLVREARRRLIARFRRRAGAAAQARLRRTAGASIARVAGLLGRSPVAQTATGERLIVRLLAVAERVGGRPPRAR